MLVCVLACGQSSQSVHKVVWAQCATCLQSFWKIHLNDDTVLIYLSPPVVSEVWADISRPMLLEPGVILCFAAREAGDA